jgi:mannobiose 2-epimerase
MNSLTITAVTSLLLLKAAEVLVESKRYQSVKNNSHSLAEYVLTVGSDMDGGIFNEGGPTGVIDENKDWWPQAEALIGFINAYQISGSAVYLEAAGQVWEFTKKQVIDKKHGEWHKEVHRNGLPFELDKVRSLKCSYQHGGAALEVDNRVNLLVVAQTEHLAETVSVEQESKIKN